MKLVFMGYKKHYLYFEVKIIEILRKIIEIECILSGNMNFRSLKVQKTWTNIKTRLT